MTGMAQQPRMQLSFMGLNQPSDQGMKIQSPVYRNIAPQVQEIPELKIAAPPSRSIKVVQPYGQQTATTSFSENVMNPPRSQNGFKPYLAPKVTGV